MKLELQSALAALTPEDHFHHPGLRYAQFVFCDDLPNDNNQGIEYEDFADVAKSAIGTPVKIKFLGESAGGHLGSVPFGFISSITEEEFNDGANHRLIANATLFARDYPDEIEYLQARLDDKTQEPPGVSWELSYKDSILKNGIDWLKGVITQAATFVKAPAYGSRTALLALASNKTISADDFSKELSAFANELSPKTTIEGGNNIVEEELRLAREALVAANQRVADLEAANAELTTANETLTTDNTTLQATVAERDTALAEVALRDRIVERTRLVSEAGIKVETDAEKLKKRQAFWASFEDDAFAEYLEDLKTTIPAKPSKDASAALHLSRLDVPRLSVQDANAETVTPTGDLLAKFRGLKNIALVSE